MFSLLEWIITMSIVIITLPIASDYVINTYLTTTRTLNVTKSNLEKQYIDTFLHQDMNPPAPNVTYSLKDGHLKRELTTIENGVTKKSSLFLNHQWLIDTFTITSPTPYATQFILVGKDKTSLILVFHKP
jgi:hypothetical protein